MELIMKMIWDSEASLKVCCLLGSQCAVVFIPVRMFHSSVNDVIGCM